MGWLLFLVYASATCLALWQFGKLERNALELTGASLCLALAGYAWQGSIGPRKSREGGRRSRYRRPQNCARPLPAA